MRLGLINDRLTGTVCVHYLLHYLLPFLHEFALCRPDVSYPQPASVYRFA